MNGNTKSISWSLPLLTCWKRLSRSTRVLYVILDLWNIVEECRGTLIHTMSVKDTWGWYNRWKHLECVLVKMIYVSQKCPNGIPDSRSSVEIWVECKYKVKPLWTSSWHIWRLRDRNLLLRHLTPVHRLGTGLDIWRLKLETCKLTKNITPCWYGVVEYVEQGTVEKGENQCGGSINVTCYRYSVAQHSRTIQV